MKFFIRQIRVAPCSLSSHPYISISTEYDTPFEVSLHEVASNVRKILNVGLIPICICTHALNQMLQFRHIFGTYYVVRYANFDDVCGVDSSTLCVQRDSGCLHQKVYGVREPNDV